MKAMRNGLLKIFPPKKSAEFLNQFRSEGKIKRLSKDETEEALAKGERRGGGPAKPAEKFRRARHPQRKPRYLHRRNSILSNNELELTKEGISRDSGSPGTVGVGLRHALFNGEGITEYAQPIVHEIQSYDESKKGSDPNPIRGDYFAPEKGRLYRKKLGTTIPLIG